MLVGGPRLNGFLEGGWAQTIGVIITALSGYGIARITRAGSREANQTTGWTSLVGALQKEVSDLRTEEDSTRAEIKKVVEESQSLARRVYVLERSRHRWKGWGQQVVEVMQERGIRFPPPPEPLEDTDPNMESAR